MATAMACKLGKCSFGGTKQQYQQQTKTNTHIFRWYLNKIHKRYTTGVELIGASVCTINARESRMPNQCREMLFCASPSQPISLRCAFYCCCSCCYCKLYRFALRFVQMTESGSLHDGKTLLSIDFDCKHTHTKSIERIFPFKFSSTDLADAIRCSSQAQHLLTNGTLLNGVVKRGENKINKLKRKDKGEFQLKWFCSDRQQTFSIRIELICKQNCRFAESFQETFFFCRIMSRFQWRNAQCFQPNWLKHSIKMILRHQIGLFAFQHRSQTASIWSL